MTMSLVQSNERTPNEYEHEYSYHISRTESACRSPQQRNDNANNTGVSNVQHKTSSVVITSFQLSEERQNSFTFCYPLQRKNKKGRLLWRVPPTPTNEFTPPPRGANRHQCLLAFSFFQGGITKKSILEAHKRLLKEAFLAAHCLANNSLPLSDTKSERGLTVTKTTWDPLMKRMYTTQWNQLQNQEDVHSNVEPTWIQTHNNVNVITQNFR